MNNDTSILNLTFMQLWIEYDCYIKLKLKQQSYRKEKSTFINHIVPYFKDYLVININAKVYVNWLNTIEESYDYSLSFKKSLHGFMVSILNYAVKFYDLKCNIASKVGGFNPKKSRIKKIQYWTLEEFNSFIKVVDNSVYKTLFTLLYYTGLRLGECLALNWHDFKNDYLDINKTISKERDNLGNYIFNSPKTISSIREVRLDNYIIQSLNELKREQKKQKGFNNDWFIFYGKNSLPPTTISRKKDNYCKLAKVKKIRLHDFWSKTKFCKVP